MRSRLYRKELCTNGSHPDRAATWTGNPLDGTGLAESIIGDGENLGRGLLSFGRRRGIPTSWKLQLCLVTDLLRLDLDRCSHNSNTLLILQ